MVSVGVVRRKHLLCRFHTLCYRPPKKSLGISNEDIYILEVLRRGRVWRKRLVCLRSNSWFDIPNHERVVDEDSLASRKEMALNRGSITSQSHGCPRKIPLETAWLVAGEFAQLLQSRLRPFDALWLQGEVIYRFGILILSQTSRGKRPSIKKPTKEIHVLVE